MPSLRRGAGAWGGAAPDVAASSARLDARKSKNARVLAGIPLRLRISAVACMGGLSHSVRTRTRRPALTSLRHMMFGSIAKPLSLIHISEPTRPY